MQNKNLKSTISFVDVLCRYKSNEDACEVLKLYLMLHHGKIGQHWLWCAMERIAHGEDEIEVLDDYGYAYYDGDEK